MTLLGLRGCTYAAFGELILRGCRKIPRAGGRLPVLVTAWSTSFRICCLYGYGGNTVQDGGSSLRFPDCFNRSWCLKQRWSGTICPQRAKVQEVFMPSLSTILPYFLHKTSMVVSHYIIPCQWGCLFVYKSCTHEIQPCGHEYKFKSIEKYLFVKARERMHKKKNRNAA